MPHAHTYVHVCLCTHACTHIHRRIYFSFMLPAHTGQPCTGPFGISQGPSCQTLCTYVFTFTALVYREHGILTLHLKIPPTGDTCHFCSHCISQSQQPHLTCKERGTMSSCSWKGYIDQLPPEGRGPELYAVNAEEPDWDTGAPSTC